MPRQRIHIDPLKPPPKGLNKLSRRYRARYPGTGQWGYFAGDYLTVCANYRKWREARDLDAEAEPQNDPIAQDRVVSISAEECQAIAALLDGQYDHINTQTGASPDDIELYRSLAKLCESLGWSVAAERRAKVAKRLEPHVNGKGK